MNAVFNQIHKNLTIHLEEYIKAMNEKYGKYINPLKLLSFENMKDFSNIIKIEDTSTINGFANRFHIFMPSSAHAVFEEVCKNENYGKNKEHSCYDKTTLILNNNTFADYVYHLIVSGTDTEGYYEDLLLHEAMHFYGSGGRFALDEGINELLTRKLALDKGFRTNGCGYNKEVGIAYELQNILGEDVINQLAFLDETEKKVYLRYTLGNEACDFFFLVRSEMEKEFHNKYYKYMNDYNGMSGIMAKVNNYNSIDYNKVYDLINSYKYKKDEMMFSNRQDIILFKDIPVDKIKEIKEEKNKLGKNNFL